jgi:hypothetical protein
MTTGEKHMPARLQSLSVARLNRLRQQELVGRRALRLIFLGLAFLSTAGLLYLTQASAVTTTTYEIEELQAEKERLQREADRLRAEIAMLTAPDNMRERALVLGFYPSSPANFLSVAEIPSIERAIPVAAVEDTPPTSLQMFIAQANDWLQFAVSFVPAPAQVEAGSAE